ncbi:flagellar protein FlgJ [Stackebrandtia albiflava]|uniref:Flagellar protein FlgJ n=1 Tax=Stackebrandtia albiflava TaxID=406432 RepID=A0A562VH15_9ACTN|nr:glucosaminidase domain-containing protein [Stackebrandtia albiflava]TWJ17160.1 flagellar protein FlgJ [Stackebrandtia albiflava]
MTRAVLVATTVIGIVTALPQAAQAVDRQRFIDSAGESAQPSRTEYGVPASVTVAQAILESGWGESELARESRNHFGMKCHDGDPGPIAVDCVETDTRECDDDGCFDTRAWFRVYETVADSFSDHGRNLYENPRYDRAFDFVDDPDRFIREVHGGGYATDPKYTEKITALMRDYDLYRFDTVDPR